MTNVRGTLTSHNAQQLAAKKRKAARDMQAVSRENGVDLKEQALEIERQADALWPAMRTIRASLDQTIEIHAEATPEGIAIRIRSLKAGYSGTVSIPVDEARGVAKEVRRLVEELGELDWIDE